MLSAPSSSTDFSDRAKIALFSPGSPAIRSAFMLLKPMSFACVKQSKISCGEWRRPMRAKRICAHSLRIYAYSGYSALFHCPHFLNGYSVRPSRLPQYTFFRLKDGKRLKRCAKLHFVQRRRRASADIKAARSRALGLSISPAAAISRSSASIYAGISLCFVASCVAKEQ